MGYQANGRAHLKFSEGTHITVGLVLWIGNVKSSFWKFVECLVMLTRIIELLMTQHGTF